MRLHVSAAESESSHKTWPLKLPGALAEKKKGPRLEMESSGASWGGGASASFLELGGPFCFGGFFKGDQQEHRAFPFWGVRFLQQTDSY